MTFPDGIDVWDASRARSMPVADQAVLREIVDEIGIRSAEVL